MATYTQQCSKVGSFSYATNFTLYVILSNRNGNSSTNKSIVDFNVYCQSSGSGSIDAKHALYFALNGTAYRNETVQVKASSPNAYISIASGSVEVAHNSDGTKTIPFSASIKANSYGVSASLSGNFTLTTIPRYANLTSLSVASRTINSVTFNYTTDRTARLFCSIDGGTTWLNNGNPFVDNTTSGSFTVYYADRPNTTRLSPNTTYSFYVLCRAVDSGLDTGKTISGTTYDYAKITSAPNFTDEQNPTINYTNPFGNSATTLEACISLTGAADGIAYRSISKTGTSYTFNLTEAERNVLRKAAAATNSLAVKFYIRTIYNQNYHSIADRTVSIVNANPTFSNFTYQDTNSTTTALTGNNQTIIKGYSNVKGIVSVANKAVAKKQASMSKYRLSIGEKTAEVAYSSSAEVGTTINAVQSNSFTMYAIDSRGNSTGKTITASTYINYSPIKITSLNAIRTNSVTSETTLNFSGTIWNGSFGSVTNAINSCSYRYRRAGTSTWTNGTTNVTPTKNGSNFSFSGKIVGDLGATGFNIDNGYEIQVLIADKLSNNHGNPNTFTLGPGTPAMAIYKNNVAVGQRYDTSVGEKMQINGNVKLQRTSTNVTSAYFAKRSDTGTEVYMGIGSGGINHGLYSINHNKWLIYGDGTNVRIGTTPSGNAGTPAGGSTLVIKSVNNTEAPNNGVVLEYGNSTSWVGQLYIGDSSTQGIYYNGWSDGVRGSWRKLADAPVVLYDNASGTTGTVQLSESTAKFNYLEIFYARKSSVVQFESVKVYSPNSKSIGLSLNYSNGENTSQYYSKIVTISGTNIAVTREIATTANGTYGTVSVAESTVINIYKVIGYR